MRCILLVAVLVTSCLPSACTKRPRDTAARPGVEQPGGGPGAPAEDREPAPANGGVSGVPSEPAADDPGERIPMVTSDHPLYERLEGAGFANECKTDGDCKRGGCSGEICSSDAEVMSTCEMLPITWPEGSACGCIGGECQWWNPQGTNLEGAGPKAVQIPERGVAESEEGKPCGKERCKPNEECIEYYGIAGPQGPSFRECGIRCERGRPNDGCPQGMRCQNIADGPGPVCR